MVHRHASALAVSPTGRYVVCANAADDNLSVIDVRTDRVVETIWVKPSPADLFGASPNALAFDRSGKTLYAANGTQNAVAVVRFNPSDRASEAPRPDPRGLVSRRHRLSSRLKQLCVANIKELADGQRRKTSGAAAGDFNSLQYTGSLSIVSVPRPFELAATLGSSLGQFPSRSNRQVETRAAGPDSRARAGAGAHRRAERLQARRLRDQGEPHLRSGAGRHRRRGTATRRSASSASASRRTSTRWPGNSSCSTTRTAAASSAPTDTSGPRPPSGRITWKDHSPAGRGAIRTAWARTKSMPWPTRRPGSSGTTPSATAERSAITASSPCPPSAGPTRSERASRTGPPAGRNSTTPRARSSSAPIPAIESLRPYLASGTVGWNMEVPDVFRARYFIQELREYEKTGDIPRPGPHLPAQ